MLADKDVRLAAACPAVTLATTLALHGKLCPELRVTLRG